MFWLGFLLNCGQPFILRLVFLSRLVWVGLSVPYCWLCGKTSFQRDLLFVEWDVKFCWTASEEVEPMPDHFSGRSTGCQSSIEWHTRWWCWRSRRCPQRQHIWMTWSRQLFQFILCGHPTPRCWMSQERKLSLCIGLFRSRLHKLGTHYHPTFWRTVDTFKQHLKTHLFSLNLMPPAPLYLQTLWCYTNAVIIIIIIIIIECLSIGIRGWCRLARSDAGQKTGTGWQPWTLPACSRQQADT